MTVAGAEGRRGAIARTDQMFKGNAFFQRVGISSAKRVMGQGGSALQVLGLGNASTSELLTDSQRWKDLGVTRGQRITQMKNKMSAMVGAYSGLDPKLQEALGAADGDLSRVPKMLMRRILRETIMPDDRQASGMAEMLSDIGRIGDPSKVSDRQMKQWGSGHAIAMISTEEEAKMKLLGSKAAEGIKEAMGGFDANAWMNAFEDYQQKRENYDVKAGNVFLVRILREEGQSMATPEDARKPAGK